MWGRGGVVVSALNFIIYLFIYLFQQYLDRGAQFSEAGLNGAPFNINLHTNNILQNTKFQIG